MNRIRSDIYIDAIKKIAEQENGFFYVARKGEPSAGAIFILMYDITSVYSLYVPKPTQSGTRNFLRLINRGAFETCQKKLQQELDFDRDIWVIEIVHKQMDELAEKLNLCLPEES